MNGPGSISNQLGNHCPECETPNQFGDLCSGCQLEQNRINACEEAFNNRHSIYD